MKSKNLVIFALNFLPVCVFGSVKEPSGNLIEEGKTWWYEGTWRVFKKAEIGLTIGGLSDFYDGTWHEVRVKTGFYYPDLNKAPDKFENQNLDELIALVKEEDGYLKSRYVANNNFSGVMEIFEDNGWPGFLNYYDVEPSNTEREFTIHLNGKVGDKFKVGEGQQSFDATIESIEHIENSGLTYDIYTCTVAENDYTEQVCYIKNHTFIPQIGVIDRNWTPLFYAPVVPMLDKTVWATNLRYVTDKGNNIVYTGIGGAKAWEIEDSGSEDIFKDVQAAQPEYYNLQGLRIAAPAKGQVVIKHQGSCTTKIVMQ